MWFDDELANKDHAGSDLRAVTPPTLLPVGSGDMMHYCLRPQLVVALDVRTDVRPVLANSFVLKTVQSDWALSYGPSLYPGLPVTK